MNNLYYEIMNKIRMDIFDFNPKILGTLEPNQKHEIENILRGEILKGNISSYKYLRYISEIDLKYLMSSKHVEAIGEENWLALAGEIYLASPKPDLLDYIARAAKTSDNALNSLKLISQYYPKIIELPMIINDIEQQRKGIQNSKNTEKHKDPGFQYYKFTNGIIFKVKPKDFILYRFNSKDKVWIEDPDMFNDFAMVSYNYSPIDMDDIYPSVGYEEAKSQGRRL